MVNLDMRIAERGRLGREALKIIHRDQCVIQALDFVVPSGEQQFPNSTPLFLFAGIL